MISPIKKQASGTVKEKENNFEDVHLVSHSKHKKSIEDVYTRKNLNNSLSVLKSTLHKFIECGKNLK